MIKLHIKTQGNYGNSIEVIESYYKNPISYTKLYDKDIKLLK